MVVAFPYNAKDQIMTVRNASNIFIVPRFSTKTTPKRIPEWP
jgi:hypothetical protein